jgi:hypothetical protein
MLATDWPARKAAFERWQAPENFDADGTQRERLGAADALRESMMPKRCARARAGGDGNAPVADLPSPELETFASVRSQVRDSPVIGHPAHSQSSAAN